MSVEWDRIKDTYWFVTALNNLSFRINDAFHHKDIQQYFYQGIPARYNQRQLEKHNAYPVALHGNIFSYKNKQIHVTIPVFCKPHIRELTIEQGQSHLGLQQIKKSISKQAKDYFSQPHKAALIARFLEGNKGRTITTDNALENFFTKEVLLSKFIADYKLSFRGGQNRLRKLIESTSLYNYELVKCTDAESLLMAYRTPMAGCGGVPSGHFGKRISDNWINYTHKYGVFHTSFLLHMPDVTPFYIRDVDKDKPVLRGLILEKRKEVRYLRGPYNAGARGFFNDWCRENGYTYRPQMGVGIDTLPGVFEFPLIKNGDGHYIVPWGILDGYSGSHGLEICIKKGVKDKLTCRCVHNSIPLLLKEEYVRIATSGTGYSTLGYAHIPCKDVEAHL